MGPCGKRSEIPRDKDFAAGPERKLHAANVVETGGGRKPGGPRLSEPLRKRTLDRAKRAGGI